MSSLLAVEADIREFKKSMEKYNVYERKDLELTLKINATSKDVNDVLHRLFKMIKDGKKAKPQKNYLVIFLFAGHGMIKDGSQVLLYNEFDKKTGYYKMLRAEKKIRHWAEIFPNSYLIGIYACCR